MKISVKNIDATILETNPLLEFFTDGVNLDTGEIKTTNKNGQKITSFKKANYKNLEFKIYSTNTIILSGSLHKYFNDGLHNYNMFDYNSFLAVLSDLNQKFGIEPTNCTIQNLEVGLNITPPIKTGLILNYCFLHKTNKVNYFFNNKNGQYLLFEHSQYFVKIYDKAIQYKKTFAGIDSEILRFELKFNKMERINKLGIFTLNDIVINGFKIFENDILNEWNNVLFYDTSIIINSKRLINYQNPIYWSELVTAKSKSNFYKHKAILKRFTKINSSNIQQQITEIMKLKINQGT